MNAQVTKEINGIAPMVINLVMNAYTEVHGSETTLTPEQVAEVIRDQGDEANDMQPEDWARVLSEVEEANAAEDDTAGVVSVSADTIRETERQYAEKLKSEEWQAFQNKDIETGDFRKQVTVLAYLLITKDFTKAERDALPLFGTTLEGDAEKGIPASNNPDVYREKNPLNGKMETKHRLWDIVDVSPVGSSMWDYYATVYNARHNVEGCDKDLFKKGPAWLDSELKMVRQRVNTIRKSFIEGLGIARKIDAINETFDKDVEAKTALDGTGKLRRGAYCLEVGDRKSRAHSFISAGQLAKLNIAKAKTMGGTYEALMSTIARGKPPASTPEASKVKMPETKEAAYSMGNMLLHYLDANSEDGRKRIAAIRAEMASDSEGADSAIEIFGDLYMALDGMFPAMEARYNKIKNNKIEKKGDTKLSKVA